MRSGLTATMHFGFSREPLARAMAALARREIATIGRDEEAALALGIGTVQSEALGAWMRFAKLVERERQGTCLTPLGELVLRCDPTLSDAATWWVLHWGLTESYVVWSVLEALVLGEHSVEDIDAAVRRMAPEASPGTVGNARQALIRALDETPLGRDLGLVELQSDGRRVTGLTKLAVRHGQVPMAAVAYALLDWSDREQMPSAALESLVAPGSPGRALHMSEGAMERYLIEIDGAFRSQVLSYSRTAGLNEAYFRPEVTPLQVLASHYLRARDDLSWTEALDRARAETGALNETDDG